MSRKLVQVWSDPRFGVKAFFDDGSVAVMLQKPDGDQWWHWETNIQWEADVETEPTARYNKYLDRELA